MYAVVLAIAAECHSVAAGLAFAVRIDSNRSAVVFSWTNDGLDPVLVNAGELLGRQFSFAGTITMRASGPHLPSHRVVRNNEPGGVGGNINPLVICLVPGAEYDVRVATRDLVLSGSSTTLADLHSQAFTLSVEFIGRQPIVVGRNGQFVPYDGVAEYGHKFAMWIGKREVVVTP